MPINIGKLRSVDFIKESTSVSVKFTFETSIIEMSTILIIVAQDTKFGKWLEADRMAQKQFRPNNYIYRLFEKVHPILKFNFD